VSAERVQMKLQVLSELVKSNQNWKKERTQEELELLYSIFNVTQFANTDKELILDALANYILNVKVNTFPHLYSLPMDKDWKALKSVKMDSRIAVFALEVPTNAIAFNNQEKAILRVKVYSFSDNVEVAMSKGEMPNSRNTECSGASTYFGAYPEFILPRIYRSLEGVWFIAVRSNNYYRLANIQVSATVIPYDPNYPVTEVTQTGFFAIGLHLYTTFLFFLCIIIVVLCKTKLPNELRKYYWRWRMRVIDVVLKHNPIK